MMPLPLATPGYPNLPPLDFPVLGNKWAVGAFFLAHVLFGSFTMGTLALGPTYELVGARSRDVGLLRYAHDLGSVNLRIFSLGATLAGFVVIFLAGLYGRMFIPLVEIFFWPFLAAFLIWFPAIAALYLYAHSFEHEFGRRRHIALGYGAAAFDHVFLVLIVGIDSFLLTPGPGQGLGAFFNPSFWAELGHRFVGNMSWASLFLAAVYALRSAFARADEERLYRRRVARLSLVVGLGLLVPQVALGALFVHDMRVASPGAFASSFSGAASWMWLVQTSLLSLIVFGGCAYFAASRPSPTGSLLAGVAGVAGVLSALPAGFYGSQLFWLRYPAIAALLAAGAAAWVVWRRRGEGTFELRPAAQAALAVTGIAAVALFLLMGVIRTTARDPYTVYGRLTQSESQGIFTPGPGHYP